MKGFNKVLVSTLLMCGFSNLYADMPHPFGWYVEGNVGKSTIWDKFYGNGTNSRNTGTGWSIAGGYKFNHYFAAEVGYTQYAMSRITNPVRTTIGQDQHWSVDLAGKGILPIFETGFELFAKAGIGHIYSYTTLTNQAAAAAYGINLNTGSHSRTMYYVGGGLDYAFTRSLIANVQWMRQRGGRLTGDGILESVGLSWIF